MSRSCSSVNPESGWCASMWRRSAPTSSSSVSAETTSPSIGDSMTPIASASFSPSRPAPCPPPVDAGPEDVAHLVLVGVGGGPRLLALALDAMDGRALALDPVEQRRLRHAVVRALVVRRNAPLIAPPERDAGPVHIHGRELLVRGS